jgi:2-amino-4-hydroxy-6-hydroxymethyldihydropteridine diphosphokinase
MKAFVGLGANLGDAGAALAGALQRIAALPRTRMTAASSVYATAPIDSSGPDYRNAVAALDTVLPARELLAALQAIEAAFGRERPYRNAPRTLDLDLLLYGGAVIAEPGLELPHPRLHERAFVLVPLLELDPALVHPTLGPLAPYLARVARQPIRRL